MIGFKCSDETEFDLNIDDVLEEGRFKADLLTLLVTSEKFSLLLDSIFRAAVASNTKPFDDCFRSSFAALAANLETVRSGELSTMSRFFEPICKLVFMLLNDQIYDEV